MRIRIVGGPGSGKTYLAKKLAKEWDFPFISTDDMHFTDDDIDFTKHRPKEERVKILEDWVRKKSWIIEGTSISPWSELSFEKADLIIFLNVPRLKQVMRITKRSLFEKNRKKETFFGWLELIKWCWKWPERFKSSKVRKMQFKEFSLADEAFEYFKTT